MPYAFERLAEIREHIKKDNDSLKEVDNEKTALGGPPYVAPGTQENAEALTSEESRLKKEIAGLEKEGKDLIPAAEKELRAIGRLEVLQGDLDKEKGELRVAEKKVEDERKQLADRAPTPSDKETAGALGYEVFRHKHNVQVIEREIADVAKDLDRTQGRGTVDQRMNAAQDKELADRTAEQSMAVKGEGQAKELAGEAAEPTASLEAYRELQTKREVRQPDPPPQPDKPVHGDWVASVVMLAGMAISLMPDLKEAYKHYAPKVADYIADKATEGPVPIRPTIEGVPVRDPPVTEKEAVERKGEDKRQALDKSLELIQSKFDKQHADMDPDKKKELQTKLDEQFKALHEALEKQQEKELQKIKEPPDLRFH